MAELTEEQKIIIGVCVGIGGLALIAIVIFICCIFYWRGDKHSWFYSRGSSYRKPRRHYHKERLVDRDYYDRRLPYTVYDKTVPPPYEPVYLPPPPPVRPEIYYNKPRSLDVVQYNHDLDRYSEPPPRRFYSEGRWDGGFRNEPIVVPLAEPEYVSTGEPRQEGETIYLKYVDDQALLPRTNYQRRSEYVGYGNGGYSSGLRRSRSQHELRRSTPYVGEWGKRPEALNFNEDAMRAGRDPFLWQSQFY